MKTKQLDPMTIKINTETVRANKERCLGDVEKWNKPDRIVGCGAVVDYMSMEEAENHGRILASHPDGRILVECEIEIDITGRTEERSTGELDHFAECQEYRCTFAKSGETYEDFKIDSSHIGVETFYYGVQEEIFKAVGFEPKPEDLVRRDHRCDEVQAIARETFDKMRTNLLESQNTEEIQELMKKDPQFAATMQIDEDDVEDFLGSEDS